MKSDARAIAGAEAAEATNGSRIRGDAAFSNSSPEAWVVADAGEIRLGGAWRLPPTRKAG